MCGDSHLPPAPESADLVAIIHPVSHLLSPEPLVLPSLSRTTSSASTSSTSTTSSLPHCPGFIRGRLRLSNRKPGNTTSEFAQEGPDCTTAYGMLNVRIHKYGSPLQSQNVFATDIDITNPVLHQFRMDTQEQGGSGIRLDLGVGGDGVVGRTVSIVDSESRILGEGIIGRM